MTLNQLLVAALVPNIACCVSEQKKKIVTAKTTYLSSRIRAAIEHSDMYV